MQVISGVNNSAFFAQSAYSAATATFDKNGNDIAETYYQADNPSGFISSVPDTYLQNTDLTIVDNKITEISGVPLSAGDELPSGVMITSALGYNAVNEISGYNGSAIAQYGAEKQWLVHDDTLVHAANSAQYALGVNVSAVGELLGVSGPVLNQETFAGYWNRKAVYQKLFSGTYTRTTAYSIQTISNNLGLAGYTAWIDNSNSWIDYNGTTLHLPTFYNIAANRYGNIILSDVTGNYGLQWRGTDSDANVQSTAYVIVKYIKQ